MRLEFRAMGVGGRGGKKNPISKYIFMKFQNISDKENIIKAIREEKQLIFKN